MERAAEWAPPPNVSFQPDSARCILGQTFFCLLMMRFALLLTALAWVGAAAAQSALPRFDALSVDAGLPSPNVSALAQDRNGFLWIGTEGGLVRYDGAQMRVYRRDGSDPNSLSSSFVQHVREDSASGALWVATFGGGLNRFDPATGRAQAWRHKAGDSLSLSSDQISVTHSAGGGRVWVGTGAGLDLLDPATGRVQRYDMGQGDFVRRIASDGGGGLWVGMDAGVTHFDPSTGEARLVLPTSASVWALTPDLDGALWVGTNGAGLARFDPASGTATWRRRDDGLCGDLALDVAFDLDGLLWVTTRDGGLCSIAPDGTLATYRPDPDDPYSLPALDGRSLLRDRSGLLWVGTWSSGVARMRRPAFGHVATTTAQGFGGGGVWGFAQADDDALWVGANDGLYRYDLVTGRAEQDATWPDALRTLRVRAVVRDREGGLWATAGMTKGVFYRAPQSRRFRLIPTPPNAGTMVVLDLDLAPDGRVWAAVYGPGTCFARPGDAVLTCPNTGWPMERRLRSHLGYAVHARDDGRLWLSHWGSGVDVIDPDSGVVASFTSEPGDAQSLPENSVTAFVPTRSGALWLATFGGGMTRFDPDLRGGRGGFVHLGVGEGLPEGVVYGILEDDADRLWVSTGRGFAVVDPNDGMHVRTFGLEDGLQSLVFNAGAFLKLADGRMAFGGKGGFNIVDPQVESTSAPPPQAALVGWRVLGADRPVPPDYREGLTLAYNENALVFEVAALDFAAPERNRYAYRLEGMDADWSDPTAERTVAYTNLDPGRYVLRVRAANSDEVWNESALMIPVVIRPAWWQRAWVRAFAVLALLLGFGLGVRQLSQRNLRQRVQALETERRVQRERERISRDLHDNVGAQLASLLSNVDLTRLMNARGVGGALDADADPLGSVEADARSAIRQLRETIWAIQGEAVTVDAFAKRIRADLDTRLPTHFTRWVTADGTGAITPTQALNLYRIVQEAITNTLKYAGASSLGVDVVHDGSHVSVAICDDGTFRPPQADSDGLSGFGMKSMEARAHTLGGTLDVTTEDGTCVRVRVPARAPDEARAHVGLT